MPLSRKPKVGERLICNGTVYTLTRFDDRFPSIAHIRDENGENSTFIWQFSDGGLNTLFSIFPKCEHGRPMDEDCRECRDEVHGRFRTHVPNLRRA